MTMTVRQAFEKGTVTFNAHDLDGFKEVLADDVVFKAPGGMQGEGRTACAAFFGSWFAAFPNARVEVEAVHIVDDVAVEEGTFMGTQNGVLHGPMGDIPPTGRSVEVIRTASAACAVAPPTVKSGCFSLLMDFDGHPVVVYAVQRHGLSALHNETKA